jgi:hypothetical protein
VQGSYLRVTRSSATFTPPNKSEVLTFDLHVLNAPPAFILSQDQTLLKKFETQKNSGSCGSFFENSQKQISKEINVDFAILLRPK